MATTLAGVSLSARRFRALKPRDDPPLLSTRRWHSASATATLSPLPVCSTRSSKAMATRCPNLSPSPLTPHSSSLPLVSINYASRSTAAAGAAPSLSQGSSPITIDTTASSLPPPSPLPPPHQGHQANHGTHQTKRQTLHEPIEFIQSDFSGCLPKALQNQLVHAVSANIFHPLHPSLHDLSGSSGNPSTPDPEEEEPYIDPS
uniref:Uncharacterized protein n=1 Tax=Ananas comosus var. bracteatus TaxID=296719 RepID=A0A6V7P632_ANACO|nr:unnamed protein product [Ananas comosus var. bracteatus]